MPFSQSTQLSIIAGWLEAIKPDRLLDIGTGIGCYGLIARIFLDGEKMFDTDATPVVFRPPGNRPSRIDGIEGFASYANPVLSFVYDQVAFDDALVALSRIPDDAYAAVLAIDILEHFDVTDGIRFLSEVKRVARRAALVSTPRAFIDQHSKANPYENHRSHWTRERLAAAGFGSILPNRLSWIAVCEKSENNATHTPLESGVAMHLAGRLDEAENLYRKALPQPGGDHAAHLLALLSMQRGDTDSARRWAELALADFGIQPNAAVTAVASDPDIVRKRPHGRSGPRELFVEITSRCNLRCAYCATTHPDYVGSDIDGNAFEAVVDFVERYRVPVVSCNVHGETTQHPSWRELCERLLSTGAKLNLIGNFARRLAHDEVGTLARFAGIRASIDSADRATMRDLRSGADLRIVVENLLAIRTRALRDDRKPPDIGVNCVLTPRSTRQLSELVAFCAAMGITDLMLHDMAAIEGLPARVDALSALTGSAATEARMKIGEALSLGRRLRLPITLQYSLERFIEPNASTASLSVPYFKPVARARVTTATPGVGETRDCLDPWTVIKVSEDGKVAACCIGREAMGDARRESLDAIWQGDRFASRRTALLEGMLPDECHACPARGVISREALCEKVAVLKTNLPPNASTNETEPQPFG